MKKIAIVAGGDSGEFDISLKTAANIFQTIDKELFKPYTIMVRGRAWTYTQDSIIYNIDKNDFSLRIGGEKISFDAVFIAIHGTPGENGKMQGYFDMIGIPYTGCNMFSSALTFNKFFCNVVVNSLNVPVADSWHFYKNDKINFAELSEESGFPCFVKPCNSGSSVGVTKAHSMTELKKAVKDALEFDDQFMVERFVKGREMTCGVTTINGTVQALAVTEIKSKKEYYDYEAKYTPGFLELVTPALISEKLEHTIKAYSELIFKKLGCSGVVRIDYIVDKNEIPYFLELNTIPGQTVMSIIPRQVQYLGMNIVDFYTGLLEEVMDFIN
ncbi:MAG: D-alanine--D-alanine ligase [Bacteroidales bacterium]|jgi:D-alanine-D-alanine ligase|nr:D-alanine--D-alanine ligase [Bacteroidales bacterium]